MSSIFCFCRPRTAPLPPGAACISAARKTSSGTAYRRRHFATVPLSGASQMPHPANRNRPAEGKHRTTRPPHCGTPADMTRKAAFDYTLKCNYFYRIMVYFVEFYLFLNFYCIIGNIAYNYFKSPTVTRHRRNAIKPAKAAESGCPQIALFIDQKEAIMSDVEEMVKLLSKLTEEKKELGYSRDFQAFI